MSARTGQAAEMRMNGATNPEIALQLGVSSNAVAQLVSRARQEGLMPPYSVEDNRCSMCGAEQGRWRRDPR